MVYGEEGARAEVARRPLRAAAPLPSAARRVRGPRNRPKSAPDLRRTEPGFPPGPLPRRPAAQALSTGAGDFMRTRPGQPNSLPRGAGALWGREGRRGDRNTAMRDMLDEAKQMLSKGGSLRGMRRPGHRVRAAGISRSAQPWHKLAEEGAGISCGRRYGLPVGASCSIAMLWGASALRRSSPDNWLPFGAVDPNCECNEEVRGGRAATIPRLSQW
eukprot:gene17442-biopygen3379